MLHFGEHQISKEYRAALYQFAAIYTTEEVVGSFLGHNPHFPSQTRWEKARAAIASGRGNRRRKSCWAALDGSSSELDEDVEQLTKRLKPFASVKRDWEQDAQLAVDAPKLKERVLQEATNIVVNIASGLDPVEFDCMVGDVRDFFANTLYKTELFRRWVLSDIGRNNITTKPGQTQFEMNVDLFEVDLVYGLCNSIAELSQGSPGNVIFTASDVDRMSLGSLESDLEKHAANPKCFKYRSFNPLGMKLPDGKSKHDVSVGMIFVRWAKK